MKRHKRMNRRMTNRVKAAVSALLVSSMVLNPWYGIDLAVGSENNSTRVRVSGLTGGTVKVNLESSTLKEEALRAIRESAPTELENYLSTDSTTDAAVAKLLSDPNPYYTVALWTAEDEEVFAAEGIDVRVLVQKDASTIEEDEANVASASNLKKAGQLFGASVKNRKDKDIIFYPANGTLDTLISNFQADALGHTAAEAESLDNSDYELTGDEKITILYMNTDTKSHSFKLSVDGNDYSTAVKVVGTGTAAKSMLNKLKAVMNGETETAATEAESTTAAEDNVLNPTDESATKTTEEFKNSEETTATEAESKSEGTETSATVIEENATEAATTEAAKTEAQTAEVSQAETEEKVEKEALAEKAAEAVIEEVQQLSGENTVTSIGAFTLDRFFDEAESAKVKTEEKAEADAEEKIEEKAAEDKTEAVEEKTTAAEDTSAAEKNTKEEGTEAETSADSTESQAEEATTEASKEETTAAETSAAETTEAETKAKTAMDESLATEQKQLLSETKSADLAAEIKSARLVQYTLGDLTNDFKSVTLTDADGEDAYVIRVSADKEGVIGEDWTLVAKEIVKEDGDAVTGEYDIMSAETKEALEKEGLYDQSSSLDIHFVDADGNEVEPNGQVKVEIEVSTSALPEDVNPENLQVYHLEENNGSLNVTNVANPEDIKTLDADGELISKSKAVEKVEAETETAAAEDNAEAEIKTAELSEESAETETAAGVETTTEVARLSGDVAKIKTSFTVDSFSTFTISWYDYQTRWAKLNVQLTTESGANIPNAKLVKELPEYVYSNSPRNNTIETSGEIVFGTGIDEYGDLERPVGYTYQKAEYVVTAEDGTEIAEEIDEIDYKANNSNWGSKKTYTLYFKKDGNQVAEVNCGTRQITYTYNGTTIAVNSENIEVDVRLKYTKTNGLTIKDESTTNGRFSVELNDALTGLDSKGLLVYKWYRIQNQKETKTNNDYLFRNNGIVEKVNGEALQSEDGKSLNVVLDHMYIQDADGTNAAERSYYYVQVYQKVTDGNGIIVRNEDGSDKIELVAESTPKRVSGYYQIENGGFESPSNTFDQVPVGTDGLVWKTTGIGAISDDGNNNNEKNGYDIELVNPGIDSGAANNEFGIKEDETKKVPEGSQFAELNASSEGALYQDVLTAVGSTLNWEFYHRTRVRSASEYAKAGHEGENETKYDSWSKPDGWIEKNKATDKMSVLILPTKLAKDEGITNRQSLNEFIKKYSADSSSSKYKGVQLRDFNDDSYGEGWVHHTNETYLATAYETRFYFVSGTTAYDYSWNVTTESTWEETEYTYSWNGENERRYTVGNLIDGVQFTTKPLESENESTIVITKKVYGVTQEDINDGYAVHLTVKKWNKETKQYEELIGGEDILDFKAVREGNRDNGEILYFEGTLRKTVTLDSSKYLIVEPENAVFFKNDDSETKKEAFEEKYGQPTTKYNDQELEEVQDADTRMVKLEPKKVNGQVTGNTLAISNTYTAKIVPTGVRANGMAGMMAVFMGLGMMGLMSAGYVVVRRKRW